MLHSPTFLLDELSVTMDFSVVCKRALIVIVFSPVVIDFGVNKRLRLFMSCGNHNRLPLVQRTSNISEQWYCRLDTKVLFGGIVVKEREEKF
jgi:hypothetical protein